MFSMILAFAMAPAPVQTPSFEVTLNIDPKKNIHDEKYGTVEIKNNTKEDLELKTNLPFGPLVFFDPEVRNDKGKRVSAEWYWCMISSPFSAEATLSAGTIPAGKSMSVPARVYFAVDEKDRAPGKYTCRVRFRYDRSKVDVVSDWVPFEVTAETLKTPR